MTKEQERYELQLLLDSQKSDKERNTMGQFSTPYPLAKEIARHILPLMPAGEIRFLEPAFGTGALFSALRNYVTPSVSLGFEIDRHYFTPAKRLWEGSGLNLVHGDFLTSEPRREFNLILANPPYSRHHCIDGETKKRLQARIREEFGLHVSGLSGLYCYFLILSTQWLTEDGLSCWLIPSEFLDVNYGVSVKEFLCSEVELISIHKFNPADLQFSDALVSSSVVTFRNKAPEGQMVRFTTGSRLNEPGSVTEVPVTNLDPRSKWSRIFDSIQEPNMEKGKLLGEYFKVSRGISTGNNSFFIIPEKVVTQKGLPLEYLTPVLPSPRFLHVERIEENFREIDENHKYYLLACPLPLNVIEAEYPRLFDYIKEGERKEMNTGYICRKRDPWYNSESRKPAPFYMTYMGRGEDNTRMFRFILNESPSIVTNSYLMLYPKANYEYSFRNKVTLEKVWRILNSIPKDRLARCGRSYGGGLFKIEPKELESLVVPELEGVLSPQQRCLF